jgi:DNA-binding NarL/FixJ family response regulator
MARSAVIGEPADVLVVDDDEGFRRFASTVLKQAGLDPREAAGGVEALAAAEDARPGAVLLDVCLPDVNGLEVCSRLRDLFGEELPVLFVSGERRDGLDRSAGFLVGGDDYLVKPVDPDELVARVRRAVVRSGVAPPSSRGASPHEPFELTGREREVLRLAAEGLRPAAIASELVISPKTVASHLQRIFTKLGVHTRAEAVAVAYREGLAE